MYIARKQIDGKIRYFLRESYAAEGHYRFRDILDLGNSPSDYIIYPGGNAYYIKETLEEKIRATGRQPDPDELEAIFQPFLRWDIRRKNEPYRDRVSIRSNRKGMSGSEKEPLPESIHAFDKRRTHFLRFGKLDQGSVLRMPAVLFRDLLQKSRDEIEQGFIEKEQLLRSSELKTYVYVAFDLQRFFPNFMAMKMPHVLDQERVDFHFIEELCSINRLIFKHPDETGIPELHEYFVRYLIMFFDNDYAPSRLLDEFVQNFIYTHHFHHRPPPADKINREEAMRIFGFDAESLSSLTSKGLTRRYRKLAKKCHPDKGGSNEAFVSLNDAYQRLLREIKSG